MSSPSPSGSGKGTFPKEPNLLTSLLRNPTPHEGPCDHGTFSPRANSPSIGRGPSPTESSSSRATGSRGVAYGTVPDDNGSEHSFAIAIRENSSAARRKKTAKQLAEESGVKHWWLVYLSYYIPSITWVSQYKLDYLPGDLIAGITMASVYVPMALSLASNLAHVPPVQGLYAFAINPFIYALLGSTTQMVIGPEAAGSLLVGEAVRLSINRGTTHEDDMHKNALLGGIVTSIAGAIVFASGIVRLGFLESVLSRALLRGFLSALGFVITVDQLIPELGLDARAKKAKVKHGSPVQKIIFMVQNLPKAHLLTAIVSIIAVTIIMVFKKFKARVQKRHNWVVFIPDRFLVVVLSAVFAYVFDWPSMGLEILGPVSSGKFTIQFPYTQSNLPKIREVLPTSFLISVLGFFESVIAAKSLGTSDVNFSGNRELCALGVANVFGGLACALPAFGGYGRSKLNVSTGGRTPMSSVILSALTVLCIIWLLPFFKFIPKCVLCAMITSVAFSLLEEAPSDISFFIRIRSVPDLIMMFLVFLLTIFYSLELGIAAGVGLSVVQILRHSTRSRISILGLVPPDNNQPLHFKSAEDFPEEIVHVEGCLIVKIPEPLTFANAGDLKNRLRRLEIYGTLDAHPSMPRLRADEHNRNVIFDFHGVTSMDGSGVQTLKEIVANYRSRDVRVFFSRGPKVGGQVWMLMERAGIMDDVGGRGRFLPGIEDALRETEVVGEVGGPSSGRSPPV